MTQTMGCPLSSVARLGMNSLFRASGPNGMDVLLKELGTKFVVIEIVGIYFKRWGVEDFFRVLKSVCRIEFLLFWTAKRLCAGMHLLAQFAGYSAWKHNLYPGHHVICHGKTRLRSTALGHRTDFNASRWYAFQ